MGRVFATSQSFPGGGSASSIEYAYNLAGGLISMTYPSGRVVNTSYDTANRISQLQDVYNGNTSTHASAINYWPNRVMENMNVGHGSDGGVNLVENTTLNSRLQVSSRNVQRGSVFPVQFSFTYGATGQNNGNLTAQQIQTIAAPNPPCVGAPPCTVTPIPALNLTQTYGYDAYDRLLSAAETGGTSEWTQNYLYDQWGNRAVQTGSYIPNPSGTPTAVSQFTNNRWMGTGASYDAAGDATAAPGMASETFTYDAENRVSTAVSTGTTFYAYDGEGRRVQKTTSPSTFTTNYFYDAFGKVIQETTIPTSTTSYPTDAPLTGTEYLIGDHLGSTRVAMNNQGQVVRRYDFLPFGEEIVAGVGGRGADYEPSSYMYPTTPDDVLKKFTGKERDSETGLDFFGARYFSAAQGRFTSADWSAKPEAVPYSSLEDPQTLNLYSYVRNNPLARADADGHCGLDDPSGCTLKQFLDSVPDRTIGGLKFEANAALEMIGVGPKFTASNAEQADAMRSGEEVKPYFQQGLAMLIPGPKGEKGVKGGTTTEPTLPAKTIVSEEGVTIQHYTRSGDHGPAHLHVKGEGPETRIGQMGNPLKGDPPLSSTQAQVVGQNKSAIRSSVDKIMRWFSYNREKGGQ
jgi:RHS repeat-associated protein